MSPYGPKEGSAHDDTRNPTEKGQHKRLYRSQNRSQSEACFLPPTIRRRLRSRNPRLEATCPNRGFFAWRQRR